MRGNSAGLGISEALGHGIAGARNLGSAGPRGGGIAETVNRGFAEALKNQRRKRKERKRVGGGFWQVVTAPNKRLALHFWYFIVERIRFFVRFIAKTDSSESASSL